MADYTWGTGRRKKSVARVRIVAGSGKIVVNGRELDAFFNGRRFYTHRVLLPLQVTDNMRKFDVYINVFGGGLTGQAGAASLAIARALVKLDETNKPLLKKNGLLTRDPRMVERKKYSLRKARRARQYSKR